jgi:hypothetical protein
MGTELLRCTQHDKPVHYLLVSSNPRDVITSRLVMLNVSEGSPALGTELLRYTQHANAVRYNHLFGI